MADFASLALKRYVAERSGGALQRIDSDRPGNVFEFLFAEINEFLF